MTTNRATPNNGYQTISAQAAIASSYYALLGLHPSASVVEIRRAYRELSKRYHPDTTDLAPKVATEKFQQLNEAYATLSNIEKRRIYDQKIGYSRLYTIQPLPELHRQAAKSPHKSSSAYLDPSDRPLSPGEIFALFILAVTFIGCIVLAIGVAIARPDTAFQPIEVPSGVVAVPVRTVSSVKIKIGAMDKAGFIDLAQLNR